ncbi:MAG: glutamate formimidoyltransferase [Anaerolineae bacterium]|nr:glutamate formimidoyltransferase [Anaerolineae bacterium]
MSPLVECIPNFSEGRRKWVIEAIVSAIRKADVHILDVSSDTDHNRTVVTFVGTPSAVEHGAFWGIAEAKKHIRLDEHDGVHPRIGAADVVPFVPLRGATMTDCVQIAHRLGVRVADELNLPVYFYEYAAKTPARRNLAEVRRHPYEQLKSTIQTDPTRLPDLGLSILGSAGAVAIGARDPLIAFNAYLDTDNVEIAKAIASVVRESGGGLPYLKALGLLVHGRAQVSMNITDFRKTPLHTILEAVRDEAKKHGAMVTHTELVGLIPQSALIHSALMYLGLPTETASRLLETRVGDVTGDYREIVFE